MERAMTETAVYPITFVSGAALRFGRFVTQLARSLCDAMLARATRRALAELHGDLLRDLGLTRGDILFVADALASGQGNITRAGLDHLGASDAGRGDRDEVL
jgi:uncharacterized protein YjiS (DUF1127 family)